jgi:acetyltransferase-like isoleucine patch superfamily enzyme
MGLLVGTINALYRKQIEKKVKRNQNIQIAKSAKIESYRDIRCKSGSITIGENVYINGKCIISAVNGTIEIGDDVIIGPGTIIIPSHHNFERIDLPINLQGGVDKPIKIEKDVWIGAHCTILGGTKIGAHSVIGAHSLVKGIIPPYSVAYGVPCRVKKNRKQEAINNKLLNSRIQCVL